MFTFSFCPNELSPALLRERPGRAAGNRTRSTCTPCMRTTGILRPEFMEFLVGAPRIELGLYRLRRRGSPPDCPPHVFCRGAENRTRSLRTRSVCTTGILRPDRKHEAPKRMYYCTTSKRARAMKAGFHCRASAGRKMQSILHLDQKLHAAPCGWTIPDSNRSPRQCE